MMFDAMEDTELREAIHTLLDTFSGADTAFISFASLVLDFEKRAAQGDEGAAKVLAPIKQVARLIKISGGQ